ncbi:hypothetical protein GKO49_09780 [Xanthomonas oryzae pv. oryzae]|nr:hypothetical protein GKO49_09780 [Xanthomonas oryzae pv. oryzae]
MLMPTLAFTYPHDGTGRQHDLRIDLVATTSIPGALFKQRMQALAGAHWEMRDVR